MPNEAAIAHGERSIVRFIFFIFVEIKEHEEFFDNKIVEKKGGQIKSRWDVFNVLHGNNNVNNIPIPFINTSILSKDDSRQHAHLLHKIPVLID